MAFVVKLTHMYMYNHETHFISEVLWCADRFNRLPSGPQQFCNAVGTSEGYGINATAAGEYCMPGEGKPRCLCIPCPITTCCGHMIICCVLCSRPSHHALQQRVFSPPKDPLSCMVTQLQPFCTVTEACSVLLQMCVHQMALSVHPLECGLEDLRERTAM